MNKEEIIKLAREAGFTNPERLEIFGIKDENLRGILEEFWINLERFAALVASAEREACAKVCDAVQKKNEDDGAFMWEARNCAAAIRARGEQ